MTLAHDECARDSESSIREYVAIRAALRVPVYLVCIFISGPSETLEAADVGLDRKDTKKVFRTVAEYEAKASQAIHKLRKCSFVQIRRYRDANVPTGT